MPKSRKRRKPRRAAQRPTSPETELMEALRAGVESAHPGPLLAVIGLLLGTADEHEGGSDDLRELTRDLLGIGRPETTGALLAIATLTGDDELRRRARREAADHAQVLPRWLAELHQTEPLDRAVEISTVYRDADQLLIGVTVPGGHPLTAVVLVDNELGAFAADGHVLQAPLDEALALMLEDADPDTRVRDIPTVDARARVEHALRELDLGPGPGGRSGWAESRPLLEWMVALLPAGGEGEVLRDLSDEEIDEIVEHFLASPFGPAWSAGRLRPLVDEVVTAGSANGIGDPLVWSPDNVRKLLDSSLWLMSRSTPSLDRAPELLRDLIRYGHAERGLRPELTAAALAAVDASAGAFVQAARELDEDGAG